LSINGRVNVVRIVLPIDAYAILFFNSRSFFSITASARFGRESITAENRLEGKLSREKIKDFMAENKAFAKAELFIISSEKPHIGEMSNLQDHMKDNLPSNLFSG
jgi:hypothetical protein